MKTIEIKDSLWERLNDARRGLSMHDLIEHMVKTEEGLLEDDSDLLPNLEEGIDNE